MTGELRIPRRPGRRVQGRRVQGRGILRVAVRGYVRDRDGVLRPVGAADIHVVRLEAEGFHVGVRDGGVDLGHLDRASRPTRLEEARENVAAPAEEQGVQLVPVASESLVAAA